jgi:hypothetical protein
VVDRELEFKTESSGKTTNAPPALPASVISQSNRTCGVVILRRRLR